MVCIIIAVTDLWAHGGVWFGLAVGQNQSRPTRADILKAAHIRQDHSPQGMFYSSAPSSKIKMGLQSPGHVLQFCPFIKNQDGTTVPRACSTVLPLLQRSQKAAVVHGAKLQEQLWGNREDLLKTTTFI